MATKAVKQIYSEEYSGEEEANVNHYFIYVAFLMFQMQRNVTNARLLSIM